MMGISDLDVFVYRIQQHMQHGLTIVKRGCWAIW